VFKKTLVMVKYSKVSIYSFSGNHRYWCVYCYQWFTND